MSTLRSRVPVAGGDGASGVAGTPSLPHRGIYLLQTPLLNKGTAFTVAERGPSGWTGCCRPSSRHSRSSVSAPTRRSGLTTTT